MKKMRKEDIKKGQAIVENIDRLLALRDKIYTQYPKLGKDSSAEDVRGVFELIIKSGNGEILQSAIFCVCDSIYERVNKLNQQLEAL